MVWKIFPLHYHTYQIPEDVQIKDKIAFACDNSLSTAAKGDWDKAEDDSAVLVLDKYGSRGKGSHHVQANAITGDD